MDSSDTDNYNPSISVSGNTIIVFWIDDSSDAVQGRTIIRRAPMLKELFVPQRIRGPLIWSAV